MVPDLVEVKAGMNRFDIRHVGGTCRYTLESITVGGGVQTLVQQPQTLRILRRMSADDVPEEPVVENNGGPSTHSDTGRLLFAESLRPSI